MLPGSYTPIPQGHDMLPGACTRIPQGHNLLSSACTPIPRVTICYLVHTPHPQGHNMLPGRIANKYYLDNMKIFCRETPIEAFEDYVLCISILLPNYMPI